VVYQSGAGDVINGLTNGTPYRVLVIDENTIKLQGIGQSLISRQVFRSAVSTANDTITFAGHGQRRMRAPTAAPGEGIAKLHRRDGHVPGEPGATVADGQNRIYVATASAARVVYRGPGISYGGGFAFQRHHAGGLPPARSPTASIFVPAAGC
jgi:hypothetical protein